MERNLRRIAYFSMEIGIEADVPTYSGGLGVLAGDHLRAAADMELPLVGVTLLHRQGYFRQSLDAAGRQSETPADWRPAEHFEPLAPAGKVAIMLEGREVALGGWMTRITSSGGGGGSVPIILLDTNLPQNHPDDRGLTDRLYGGDARYRIKQEAVLGIGGVRILRALGFDGLMRFHLNEGHASFLVLELLREQATELGLPAGDARVVDEVRHMCVFTTHTPVEAGHDKFPLSMVREILNPELLAPFLNGNGGGGGGNGGNGGNGGELICCDDTMNMTYLGFNLSRYINGVAKRHGEVSRQMFGNYPIDAITNGVHAATWVAPAMAEVFDRHIPDWRQDNFSLRYAMLIDGREIWRAHQQCKQRLLERVNAAAGQAAGRFDPEAFTIGFGRRATAYKRADLVLRDPARLAAIAERHGPIQIVFAGKAHPRDEPGKAMIQNIIETAKRLPREVRIVYLPGYNMELCGLMVSGCDLWLNNPRPPLEASGTSGMKAALNGVPSLSTLDGWWLEGCLEGITGWAIGKDDYAAQRSANGGAAAVSTAGSSEEADRARDAESLYKKLGEVIAPRFYQDREGWTAVMRQAIALNGSFFNTQRMVQQYVAESYFKENQRRSAPAGFVLETA